METVSSTHVLLLSRMHASNQIRPANDADWSGIWSVLEPIIRSGQTYPFARDTSEAESRSIWIDSVTETYVAVDGNDRVLGTYYIKPNQPGRASHVCNCGYGVAQDVRRQGIASAMCEHSQREAVRLGFKCMQYNLVVSTNESAVRAWKKHGFAVVGTRPYAFHHPQLGYVDALVMYKQLVEVA